ncbi:MAG: Gfo/Idh/MocA family oxidoreductase [Caldilineaceae bacterium]|nr:Gfo/Idh/MocA family oxidoreductase [Caldilineaceae bacterium]
MSRTVKVGIIGTGGMGARHASNLTYLVAAAEVAAIMDVDSARAEEIAARCGGAQLYTDVEQLISAPEVDAVVIAAPNSFHAELTKACIVAGKPVLCEKPLATGSEEASGVISAEVNGGRRLVQVGFMRQYDPAHVAVKRVSDSGAQGSALVFRSVHINPSSDDCPLLGDVITGSLIHDIHSARWMMEDEIVGVHTSYIPFSPDRPDSARYVMVQLQFAGGALGGLECNADAGYGYEIEVSITGETGVVHTSPLQSPVVRHSNASGQWVEEDWLQRFNTAYISEVQAWVQSIQDGEATGPSAWDGYVSIVVADACIESGMKGEPAEVRLPERPAIYG